MSRVSQTRLADENGFGYIVLWKAEDHWADFEVVCVDCLDEEGRPLHANVDGEAVEGVEQAEVFMHGFIKWDGCAEVRMPGHHFCGAAHFKRHAQLMEHLYRHASVVMGRGEDGLDEPWPDCPVEPMVMVPTGEGGCR